MKLVTVRDVRILDAIPQEHIDKAFFYLLSLVEATGEAQYHADALKAAKSISKSASRKVQEWAVARGDLELALGTAERLGRRLSKGNLQKILALAVRRKDDQTIIASATLLYSS